MAWHRDIILIYDGLVYLRMYAPLGLNVLVHTI